MKAQAKNEFNQTGRQMNHPGENAAFIDGQNLYCGIKKFGDNFSYRAFRTYLRDVHDAGKAYIFLGYIPEMKSLYTQLENDGFNLLFKSVTNHKSKTKGNVDVFLALKALMLRDTYNKAILVTSDGDFADLIYALKELNAFKALISPEKETCSFLLKKAVGGRITYIKDILHKMKRKK